MTDTVIFVVTLLAALGAGIIAGVFFAFSAFVMQALSRRPAAEGVAAMQAINVAVVNPLFMTAFLGTGLLSLGLAAYALISWVWRGPMPGALLLAGGLLYLVGCLGVTMLGNVPRNDALARLKADSAEAAEYWLAYVGEWTTLNHIRTLASLLACAAFILAMH